MRLYRIAFKSNSQGHGFWPVCREHGIAAIGYREFLGIDLSQAGLSDRDTIPRGLLRRWDGLSGPQKGSLRHLVCDFAEGDILYVKSGLRIVGKGRVLGGYYFDPNTPVCLGDSKWEH